MSPLGSARGAKVVVTGAPGFLGRVLVATARDAGLDVLGLGRRPSGLVTPGYRQIDLGDGAALHACLDEFAPRVVLHAAGAPHYADAARQSADNVAATHSLLAANRALRRPARVVLVSSAAVYGDAGPLPWGETLPVAPVSEYGRSKALAERLAQVGDDVLTARVFNLCGPGQDAHHVCGALALQVAAVRRGAARQLVTGPRHTVRDFLDVRDAADALLHLAFTGATGAVVNVGSGRGTSIAEVLACLMQLAELPPGSEVVTNEVRAGVACSVADITRLRASGFRPRRDLRESLRAQLRAALAGST